MCDIYVMNGRAFFFLSFFYLINVIFVFNCKANEWLGKNKQIIGMECVCFFLLGIVSIESE